MMRDYTVTMGGKSTVIQARNVNYATREGMDALGYKISGQRRGRGVKAEVNANGQKVYTVLSGETVVLNTSADDLFGAYTTAMATLGGTVVPASGKRGRPRGSKNKNPRVLKMKSIVSETDGETK